MAWHVATDGHPNSRTGVHEAVSARSERRGFAAASPAHHAHAHRPNWLSTCRAFAQYSKCRAFARYSKCRAFARYDADDPTLLGAPASKPSCHPCESPLIDGIPDSHRRQKLLPKCGFPKPAPGNPSTPRTGSPLGVSPAPWTARQGASKALNWAGGGRIERSCAAVAAWRGGLTNLANVRGRTRESMSNLAMSLRPVYQGR